jgi:hypothetical protein
VSKFRRIELLVFKRYRQSPKNENKKYFTFAGFKANADNTPPRKSREKKHLPWRGCVSEDWITESETRLDFPLEDESLNVLKFRLPDELFADKDDTFWLGLAEDELLVADAEFATAA